MIRDIYIKGVAAGGGGVTRSTATLMKTGQTTSFRTGDDGDLQAGRDVDFFTLAENNPFGHAQRFTGTTGGYYDQSLAGYYDVDGVPTTRLLAFPNEILCDWSTYNGSTFLMYALGSHLSNTLDNILTTYLSATYGGLSGWTIWNIREALNLCAWQNGISVYDYEPIISSSLIRTFIYFTGNSKFSTVTYSFQPNNPTIGIVAVTLNRGGIAKRYATITDITL